MVLDVPSLVGRKAEIEEVSRFVDLDRAGPAALALVGESGIGKTTLLRTAQAMASERSYRVLTCRPIQGEVRLSFAALSDLFEGVEDETLSQLPPPQRQALEAALLRKEWTQDPVDERAVSAAVLSVLRILSSAGPVLIAADDVQWLDQPSARALGFAFRRLEHEHVRLLAVERHPVRHDGEASFLSLLPRDALELLALGPISLDELDQLLRTRLELLLLRPTLGRLQEASEGNPFFALEIGRALKRRGTQGTPGEPLPVPDNMRDLVKDRLAALPETTVRMVEVASMLSEPSVQVVTAALDEADRNDLLAAVDAGVLELNGDALRFAHPVLALVAYSGIPAGRKRALHLRLAQVVASTEEQARHLALGTIGTDPAVADSLEEAAHEASDRGAPSSAAELAELARSLTPDDRQEAKWRRAVRAADYYAAFGEVARARNILQEAVRSAPSGPVRAEALLLLGDWTQEPRTAIDLLERGLGEAGGDVVLAGRIRRYLVGQCISVGDVQTAAAHAAAGLELAERTGPSESLGAALFVAAETDFLLGQGLRVDLLDRALAQSGDTRQFHLSASMRSVAGALDEARDLFGGLLARAEDRGEEPMVAVALLELSYLEHRAGNWDDAWRHAKSGYALALKTGWEPLIPWAMTVLGRMHAGRGDPQLGDIELARSQALEGLALMQATGQAMNAMVYALPLLGFIELSAGNPAGVDRYLGSMHERCESADLREPGYLRFVPDEVEALVAMGNLERAAHVLEPFEERSRALDRAFGRAMSARCRGMIRAGAGDVEAAMAAVDEALLEHERAPEPFELARTLLLLGELHRRRKHKQAARDALERALGIFDGLGANLWSKRAVADLDRLGKRPPSRWELSPTEQQVAERVAMGMRNQEVADALFMSTKTVAHHLTKVYEKLGIRSRTELASRLAAAQSNLAGASPSRD